jgi:iron complex outermembrane recepter protein
MGTRARILLGCTVVSTHPAYAQRTDNNAVTAAEDAFGKSVGDQSIGIYNAMDVRGFSPLDAGNIRIEGLYFDLAANVNGRLSSGSSIRVGISAQGYPFPAPTGIVDYELAKPGGKLLTSVGLTYGPWRGVTGEVDLQVPIDGERLGIAAGVDVIHDGSSYGSISKTVSTALVGRYAPRKGIEILPFWSRARDDDNEAQPVIYTAGAFLPKRIARNTFTGQHWADYAGVQSNYGFVARADLAGLDVRLGVFRSKYTIERNASDLLYGAQPDGTAARRYILTDINNTGDAISGELRIARSFTEGQRRHTIIASLRARDRTFNYGSFGNCETVSAPIVCGTELTRLGASRYDVPDYRAEPFIVTGPKTRDRVTQKTFALGYEGKWLGVGELTLGLQTTRYTKRVFDPTLAVQAPETRDKPLLVSAAGALYITPQLAAYAGYTRGLEESQSAPSNANNFNQAPPAIRTEQADAGIRWKVSPGVSMVAGVFEVRKPYFNVDSVTGDFRQLGIVRHRGVEFSLTGQIAPNLRAVIGNSLIDAKVRGDEVTRGLIGAKPVGAFVRHTIVSLNYRIPTHPKLSFDAFFEGSSGRTANAANTLTIPARAVMHLGMRYRFKIQDKPVLFRAQVANVTNTFGWAVTSSGGFTPNGSRRFLISLSADI